MNSVGKQIQSTGRFQIPGPLCCTENLNTEIKKEIPKAGLLVHFLGASSQFFPTGPNMAHENERE